MTEKSTVKRIQEDRSKEDDVFASWRDPDTDEFNPWAKDVIETLDADEWFPQYEADDLEQSCVGSTI